MNLSKLFKIQKQLDDRIVKEKGLEGQNLLDKKILALQVELGKLANEWRGFKFWSNDQEPRLEHECAVCEGEGSITLKTEAIKDGKGERVTYIDCDYCNGDGYLDKNPLLEEYVDCLRFILSIGNDLGLADEIEDSFTNMGDMPLIGGFKAIYRQINDLSSEIDYGNSHDVADNYEFLINDFIGLGEKLGFTRKQIEQAYLEKNKINHERQASGY